MKLIILWSFILFGFAVMAWARQPDRIVSDMDQRVTEMYALGIEIEATPREPYNEWLALRIEQARLIDAWDVLYLEIPDDHWIKDGTVAMREEEITP